MHFKPHIWKAKVFRIILALISWRNMVPKPRYWPKSTDILGFCSMRYEVWGMRYGVLGVSRGSCNVDRIGSCQKFENGANLQVTHWISYENTEKPAFFVKPYCTTLNSCSSLNNDPIFNPKPPLESWEGPNSCTPDFGLAASLPMRVPFVREITLGVNHPLSTVMSLVRFDKTDSETSVEGKWREHLQHDHEYEHVKSWFSLFWQNNMTVEISYLLVLFLLHLKFWYFTGYCPLLLPHFIEPSYYLLLTRALFSACFTTTCTCGSHIGGNMWREQPRFLISLKVLYVFF